MSVEEKAILRKKLRLQGRETSVVQLQEWSVRLMQKVEEHPRFVAAQRALLYWSLPDEPDTHDFLKRWYGHKQIYLPCVEGDVMRMAPYEGENGMHSGAFGINEPTAPCAVEPSSLDFILVPGTAFDRQGHRMGRGKGYYDRFLPLAPNAYKLGICFPFRLLPSIPFAPHDVLMDEVLQLE